MNPFEKFTKAANPFRQFVQQGGPEQIATTKDGGKIFRNSDGSMSFSSPGYSTNDQEAVARLMEGATPLSEAQKTTDDLTISQHPVAARVQEVTQGAPLVGEWLDEGVEAFSPKAAGAMRATSDAMERQHPVQSAALNIAGGVATAAPFVASAAGGKAVDWVAKGGTKLARGARAGAIAAPAGAVEGAAALSGRDNDNRIAGGATGAVVGGGIAAALGPLAPLLSEGVANLARRIKRLDVRTIASEFGVSNEAARVLRSQLANDDLDAASKILARGGDDAMLAEAGPATRNALDTAMATGGDALATARPRVDQRAMQAGAKFKTTLNNVLGDAEGGIKGQAKRIAQRTSAARSKAYEHAYAQPTPMAGKAGRDLQAALERVSPKVMQRAVDEANDMMRNKGLKNLNIMASIDDATGEVTFSQPLAVSQLDYIARALGQIAADETDKLTGKMSGTATRASSQAKAIRDALKEGVDGYARALKLGGDNIRETDALVMGRKLLNESTTFEDVRTAMAGASDAEKMAAKKGLRENIEAVMGRARATIADMESGSFDFDTGQNALGEAVAAVRAMTTPNNFRKARAVLGGDAKTLFDEMQRTSDAMILRSAVARNSATAIRQAGQDQMAAETAPGLLRRSLGNAGNPLDGAKEITQTLAGIDPQTISDAQRGYYAEIADALTRIKGPAAQKALDAVKSAMTGQPMKDADARLIGRLVAGNAASLGYQAGKQLIAPQ